MILMQILLQKKLREHIFKEEKNSILNMYHGYYHQSFFGRDMVKKRKHEYGDHTSKNSFKHLVKEQKRNSYTRHRTCKKGVILSQKVSINLFPMLTKCT